MTLRARLTALTTVLLGGVLAGVGVALERLDARDVERSLDERARDRAAAPFSPADRAGGAPTGGRPAPSRATGDAVTVETLAAEADGARLEVFHVEVPAPASRGGTGSPRLRRRAAVGTPRLDPGLAVARAATIGPRAVERLEADGATWAVAVDPSVGGPGDEGPLPPPRRGPRANDPELPPLPPRPGDPAMQPGGLPPGGFPDADEDDRPPPPRRIVAVAFLEVGPARSKHAASVARMAAIGLAALVAGAALAWLLAGRMLKPVKDAAAAAEGIERLEQRLPVSASQDELSRLVAVLNGMLARLEAATERERLFLATASHELRRPLTALLGELELARKEGRDAQSLRASVSLASEDAQAMKRLVDDLLRHARAQAGTLKLAETEIDLVELVVEAVERSRRTLPGSLRVRVGDLPNLTLRGDADALREVLENLLVNAGVHGGADVQVDVGAETRGGEVLVHVDDDGEGISPEDMARLFEPFSRGDRTRSVPGFGLGLAIARDTAEAHGGRVTVASPLRPGDPKRPGTRFTLHLPASRIATRA